MMIRGTTAFSFDSVDATGTALVRVVAPDHDCDNSGVLNVCEGSSDVAMFIDQVSAAAPNPLLACFFDRNADGEVNGLDIQLFVDSLLSGM